MNVVYLLVTGGIESRTVIGVYTDRTCAYAAADAINAQSTDDLVDATVEGCELNPAVADVLAAALWLMEDGYDARLKDYERRKRAAGIED
jgi:hypothetical protein